MAYKACSCDPVVASSCYFDGVKISISSKYIFLIFRNNVFNTHSTELCIMALRFVLSYRFMGKVCEELIFHTQSNRVFQEGQNDEIVLPLQRSIGCVRIYACTHIRLAFNRSVAVAYILLHDDGLGYHLEKLQNVVFDTLHELVVSGVSLLCFAILLAPCTCSAHDFNFEYVLAENPNMYSFCHGFKVTVH